MELTRRLTTSDHDRDVAGMIYVYPVVSRRAGGVSVGINLNPNNACNWRCIYCQVPGLTRGGPPPIDLALLRDELRAMLTDIVEGDFMVRQVPADMRRLNDVALSGNGEPTSAAEFPEVVEIIGKVLGEFGLAGKMAAAAHVALLLPLQGGGREGDGGKPSLSPHPHPNPPLEGEGAIQAGFNAPTKLVLITNGSLAGKAYVREGLRRMAQLNGEVWFKLDRATAAGMNQINDTEADPERHYQRLKTVAGLCPTWVQTCAFALDGAAPAEAEVAAYLDLLARARAEAMPLSGVLLYGLARPSMQTEAPRLSRLPPEWLDNLAVRIKELGLDVKVSV